MTKRGQRSPEILRASADLFARRGFAGVTVAEIAAQVGISPAAIYRHFTGKDEILAALFDEALDRLVEATGGAPDDPFAELEHRAREHARFVVSERQLAAIRAREERALAEPFRQQLALREQRYVERWETCIRRCHPDLDAAAARGATLAALGALNSVAEWPRKVVQDAEAVEILVRTVCGVVRSLGAQVPR